MQYNDKFGMRDLFMNKDLKGLFPQFTRKDKLQNVYSYEWIENKVAQYIKSAFNGRMSGGEIIIHGKYKATFKQISGMKKIIEDMFNNMPAITKNIRKNAKLITPFQCVDQLKEITDPQKKIAVMQIVFDNLNYNPDFKSENRFSTELNPNKFLKKQEAWLKSVGYYDKRRNNNVKN